VISGEDITNSLLVFLTGDADGLCEPRARHSADGLTPEPTALIPLAAGGNGAAFGGDRAGRGGIVERYKSHGFTPVVAMGWVLSLRSQCDAWRPGSPITGKRLDADSVPSIDELAISARFSAMSMRPASNRGSCRFSHRRKRHRNLKSIFCIS
jgi:glutamine synthetase